MPEKRKWNWLCSVIHDSDIGRTFAGHLKKRMQEKYGEDVRVKIDWHGIGEDDFDVIQNAIESSKYIIMVFTEKFNNEKWFTSCWKQAEKCMEGRDACLKPIVLMVKPFTKPDLPKYIKNVQNPLQFDENYFPEEALWSQLLEAVKPGYDITTSYIDLRPDETTITDKWREFFSRCYEELIDGLDPCNYIDGIFSEGLITSRQKADIYAERVGQRQNRAVLNIIIGSMDDKIKHFIRLMEKRENPQYKIMLARINDNEELRRDFEGLPPLAPQPTPPVGDIKHSVEESEEKEEPDCSTKRKTDVGSDIKINANTSEIQSDCVDQVIQKDGTNSPDGSSPFEPTPATQEISPIPTAISEDKPETSNEVHRDSTDGSPLKVPKTNDFDILQWSKAVSIFIIALAIAYSIVR